MLTLTHLQYSISLEDNVRQLMSNSVTWLSELMVQDNGDDTDTNEDNTDNGNKCNANEDDMEEEDEDPDPEEDSDTDEGADEEDAGEAMQMRTTVMPTMRILIDACCFLDSTCNL